MGKRFYMTGFPGSGNTVLQHVIRSVLWLDERNKCRLDERSRRIQAQVNRLMAIVREILPAPGNYTSTIKGKWGVLFGQGEGGDQYVIAGIPVGECHWTSGLMGSHERFDEQVVAFYRHNGFSLLYVERDPYDVIVSFATKYCPENPKWVLDNRAWLESAGRALLSHRRQRDQFELLGLDYDAFCQEGSRAIRRFAEMLRVDASDGECKKIWERFAFRNLAHPGHFQGGGVGKSQRLLGRGHVEVLRQIGLVSDRCSPGTDCAAGYRWRDEDLPDLWRVHAAFHDYLCYLIFKKPVVVHHSDLKLIQAKGIAVLAFSGRQKEVDHLLESSQFWDQYDRLCDSLGLSSEYWAVTEAAE